MRLKMSNNKKYKCVNCGEPCSALYKTYGPTVLKLTKCISCKGIVDKYIEYDPVIVMIDLVLMSREAQRHILYNTKFKAFWKLFIILMMLETYAVWRSDCLFSIAVNTLCDVRNNYAINATTIHIPISISLPETWRHNCKGWLQDSRTDDTDLFIWEKDFYVQFISTFSGIIIFISTVHILMKLIQLFATKCEVSCELLLKAFSLGNMSVVFLLPALVWSSAGPAHAGLVHFALVFLYTLVVFYNVFTVVYERAAAATVSVMVVSHCAKYLTTFFSTPFLRGLVP
ncbi:PREDICTED: protein ARV1 isoform X1 [Papilio xuthus]|uniref:Protein ARV n=2 Tax=Papilio xuthus TaxID=66420 RepID=A0AAJ7E3Y3_PAPXU|nr:PREDICTED: protein ARV1 isoform X1 [Papilio xuthus]